MKCPCCGFEADLPLMVDLNTNTLVINGHTQRIPGQEAELMTALLRRYPGTLGYDGVINAIWGVHEPKANPRKHIQVLACRLRKYLHPHGFTVRTIPKVGLRADRLDPAWLNNGRNRNGRPAIRSAA